MIETTDLAHRVLAVLMLNETLFAVRTDVALVGTTLCLSCHLSNGDQVKTQYDWEHGGAPAVLRSIGDIFDRDIRRLHKELRQKLPGYLKPKPVLRPVR